MPFVSVAETMFFLTETGSLDAPPVLLVHGLACDSHDWSWQIPALAATHRVIAVDLAGHGRSAARPAGYRPLDLARDLALLAEHLGWNAFHAVGHSLGAVVLDVLAVERPDLVSSLVLVDPALDIPVPDLGAAERTAARILGFEGVLAVRADYEAGGAAVPDWMRTWRLRRLLGTLPHVVAECYLGLRQGPRDPQRPEEWMDLLARRSCPVLALHRQPERAALEQATLAHRASRVELWEGCGHWLQVELAERFNDRLGAWLLAQARS
jgi:pimeloyl-ACP methyl ester carboxylesterase